MYHSSEEAAVAFAAFIVFPYLVMSMVIFFQEHENNVTELQQRELMASLASNFPCQ